MKTLRTFAVLIGAAALTLAGMSAANASSAGPGGCSGGPIRGGTYSSYSVTGHCQLGPGAHLTVLGSVVIFPGAGLDSSAYSTSRLWVGGSVTASTGSFFGIGCTEAHPCSANGGAKPGVDTVKGDVTLSQAFGGTFNGATIDGNLTSSGGGPGSNVDGPPFSVKDDYIGGNLTITGLHAGWFGVIRTTVGGNVTLSSNRSAAKDHMQQDSSEVVNNTIGGNLVCVSNTPHAQYGDAVFDEQTHAPQPLAYGPNHVGGATAGECSHMIDPRTGTVR